MLYLIALGEEKANCLSHKKDTVSLQEGYQGEGEVFVIKYGLDPLGPVVLACIGKELGKYLSHDQNGGHGNDEVWLRDGYQGEGEEWILHHKENGIIAFECCGKEKGKYLSHVSGKVKLQPAYQGESELWHSYDVDYLTDQQYTAQTCAWQSLEGALPQEFSFFHVEEKLAQAPEISRLLLSAIWKKDIVEYLLSRTSVTTIKVRFGLDRGGVNPPKFNLILFGTDDYGQVLTPYYLAPSSIYNPSTHGNNSGNGNVPIALVNKWLGYWQGIGQEHHPGPKIVSCDQFMTHYGFLNGYNYPVKEFYTLLDPSYIDKVPNIIIQFVLHKFSPIAEDRKVDQEFTFGLLFRADYTEDPEKSPNKYPSTREASGGNGDGGDDGSVYFDLSMPCPRTC